MASPGVSPARSTTSAAARMPPPPAPAKLVDPHTSSSCSSSSAAAAAYEHYLRLPELSALWSSAAATFPSWSSAAPTIQPALQALEITFRFISIIASDPRPYSDSGERHGRLESLCRSQLDIIASLCNHNAAAAAPVNAGDELPISRRRSSSEIWSVVVTDGGAAAVSRTSEESLLPRLSAWGKTAASARRIQLEIESQMHRSPFTLGLGEPNLSGKPTLMYDLVVLPTSLHSLTCRKGISNHENDAVFATHQIFESWVRAAGEILRRASGEIDGGDWAAAAADCWVLERAWKLLMEVVDLHMLADPDDFLRLKTQLSIAGGECSGRSAALMDLARSSRDLRRKVPWIVGVEVDPEGGPRVQEAAMGIFHRRRGSGAGAGAGEKIHLLQALMAIEVAARRFFFGYRQLVATVMGSAEAHGGRIAGTAASESPEEMVMEPPYYPSLDAAKTFLGEFWRKEGAASSSSSSTAVKRPAAT